MEIPTFYFLEKNYEESKLEQLIQMLTDCGARTVVIRNSENNNKFENDLRRVVANHM